MKTHFLLFPLLLVAPFASAATFLVDLNNNSPSPNNGRPAGTWNEYAGWSLINGTTMLDSGGGTSSVSFSKTGTMTANGNNGTTIYDPAGNSGINPSWVSANGTPTLNGASGDNFYTDNQVAQFDTATLVFGGITAGSSLSLDLLSSRNSDSAKGFFDYSLDGGMTWLGFTVLEANGTASTANGWDTKTTAGPSVMSGQAFSAKTDGFSNHRYLNMSGTLGAGITTLYVRTTDADAVTATFSVINALRLTTVPEPSSAALLLLGAAGLVSRRRR